MKDAWQFDGTDETRWPDWLKGRAKEIGTTYHQDDRRVVATVPEIAFADGAGAEIAAHPGDVIVLDDDDSLHVETEAEAEARASDPHAPTSIRIERMARASYAVASGHNAAAPWERMDEAHRIQWRQIAKVALGAAPEPVSVA